MAHCRRLSSRTSSMDSVHSETQQQSDEEEQIAESMEDDMEDRFRNEICELLSLDKTEHESGIIARKLLINGRQELVNHRDSIKPKDFDDQMSDTGDSALLKILKRYFEQQWQQFPWDWFQTFLTEQQSKDNHKYYQQVLTRTASYGQRLMKACPVFSIVLQLVLVIDGNIDEYERTFNDVWNTFVIDGCETALKKWKKYVVPTMKREHLRSHKSPLFLALRECFREPVISLFHQSKIADQQNLLEITLDCLAKFGCTAGLNEVDVKQLIAPKKHKVLVDHLRQYFGIKGSIPDEDSIPRPLSPSPLDNPRSSEVLNGNDDIVIYIPDLPPQITDDRQLEEMIRQCLKRKHRQEIVDIRCNTRLGIGTVYLRDNREKDHCINELQSIILTSDDDNDIIIKFSSEIKLTSYVVVEPTNERDLLLPDDIVQRWRQFYNVRRPLSCEQLSTLFPNIFRIISESFDEMIQMMENREFTINRQQATVYFRADCRFLEGLPRDTSVDQLRLAISNQLARTKISTGSLYIQYNQDTTNAVILTCDRARKWVLFDSIKLNGRVFMKKNALTCRLCLRPVPKNFPVSRIEKHEIFKNTVTGTSLADDRFIVELSDRRIYEECIDLGALRIADHLFHMGICPHPPSGSDDDEIDLENWFKTEMFKHKADIMPFIANSQHPVFRWIWNPQMFQEHFRHCDKRKGTRDHHGVDADQKRCLLRMTVVLNTIGVVWKDKYNVAGREVQLEEDRLKTIIYDHRSKLQPGKTILLSDAIRTPYPSTLIKVIEKDCLSVYERLATQKCRPVLVSVINGDSPGGDYRRGDGIQRETLFYRSNYFRSLDISLDNGNPTNRSFCNANCDLEILSDGRQMYPIEEFGAIYTSRVTVFRQAEDTGYALMHEPLQDVSVIAIATYKPSRKDSNRMAAELSIRMRKKIENIFAIAYHHKHDCLVLPNLSNDAVKTSPEHIAAIVKSVAEQFAGFFKSISFAIGDDEDRSNHLFKQVLDNLEVRPKEHKVQHTMIGPWRILDLPNSQQVTLSDMRICYLTPCYYGGTCRDLQDARHCRDYSHPPLCPFAASGTACKLLSSEDHMLWFTHRLKYPHPRERSASRDDTKSKNESEHPPYCRDGGRCNNMNTDHLRAFHHVPMCKYGLTCIDFKKRTDNHCREYRHADEFHQPDPVPPTHRLTPCKHSVNCLFREDPNHVKTYSHPCQYAELCRQKNKEPYLTHEPHVVDQCRMDQSCKKLDDPVHRANYRHTGMPDFLIPCRYQQLCDERPYEHRTKFSHGEQIDISPATAPSNRSSYRAEALDHGQNTRRPHCRHGSECRDIHDAHHCSKYSHPDEENHRQKIVCMHGLQCRDMDDPHHCSKYSHPNHRMRTTK